MIVTVVFVFAYSAAPVGGFTAVVPVVPPPVAYAAIGISEPLVCTARTWKVYDVLGVRPVTVALVVAKPGLRGEATEQQIIDWSREHMAVYKAPRIVEFVEQLPKSGTGKILWRELQQQHGGGHD